MALIILLHNTRTLYTILVTEGRTVHVTSRNRCVTCLGDSREPPLTGCVNHVNWRESYIKGNIVYMLTPPGLTSVPTPP
jgi:hypothetical protein